MQYKQEGNDIVEGWYIFYSCVYMTRDDVVKILCKTTLIDIAIIKWYEFKWMNLENWNDFGLIWDWIKTKKKERY